MKNIDNFIDGHLHLTEIYNKNGEHFLKGFEEYRQKCNLTALNIAALPAGDDRDVSNNILLAFYKLVNPQDFVHGGLIYTSYPAPNPAPDNMDPLTQYKELMEIGFDGIKMLEGKPQLHKVISIPLCDDYYDKFFEAAEKDKTHILFHVNDPEEFWDGEKVSEEIKKLGWYYGEGGYASNEEVYRQIYAILEKHPALCVTFAHFFFYSNSPEKLIEMFEKYPNTAIDITPGSEMYRAFTSNHKYYKSFFEKYSDKILFGTDSHFPYPTEDFIALNECICNFFTSSEEFDGLYCKKIKGFALSKEHLNKIIYSNFVDRVSENPKKINKEALKKYIEKYKHLIGKKENLKEVERLAKEML